MIISNKRKIFLKYVYDSENLGVSFKEAYLSSSEEQPISRIFGIAMEY